MKNYIHKLAKDNIKKNKIFYKHIFISVFFTFFVVFLTNVLSSSFDKSLYEKRADNHGEWDVIINNADENMINSLNNIEYEKLGYLYYGGDVIYHGSNLGCIGSYDECGLELSRIDLLEGHMPLNDKEIIIERSNAQLLNAKVDDLLKLEINYNNYKVFHEYKVVGIIEDYSTGWNSRALSFITHSVDYHEYDLMLKGDEAIIFWNELFWHVKKINQEPSMYGELTFNNTDIYNKNLYPDYYEVEYKHPNYAAFTNESDFLVQAVEIIIISFISLFSSMMTSLGKRENQFVLLRSMGMTYNQLKKLIQYEGYLLAIKALVLSLVSSLSLSVVIMGIYSYVNREGFMWYINLSSLSIQFFIACIIVYIGLVFPVLTVYDLPLTRKNGEIVYHNKVRKIRKPTFFYFVRKEILSNKLWSIFIVFLISMIVIRGVNIIDSTIDYQRQKEITFQDDREIDFIWYLNSWQNEIYNYYDFDLSSLTSQEDIHINQTLIVQDKTLKWENMYDEDKRILDARTMIGEVMGNLICIDYDYELKEYLLKKGYSEFLNLKDGEAAVYIPNFNYNEPGIVYNDNEIFMDSELYYYTNNIKKKSNGLYAKDEGLGIGKNIHLTNQSLKIKEILTFNDEVIREYFNEYTIIVNEKTLKECVNQRYGNYFVFDTDNEEAREKVVSFFVNNGVYGNESQFIDCYIQDLKDYYNMGNTYIRDLIYDVVLIVVYMILIYVMRLLATHKMRKHIGLLRNIGMTKRKLYELHIIYSSSLFLTGIFVITSFYLLLNPVAFEDYTVISFMQEYRLFIKLLGVSIIYIIYMLCMLIPIKNVLDESPIYLIK